jgi:Family of unknown function (DUF5670)
MLTTVFVILLLIWFLALVASGFGGLIHALLAWRHDS